MTNPALNIERSPRLLSLLGEDFSEAELDRVLGLAGERVPWEVWDDALYAPLADFLSRPGKEFRGRLVGLAWELVGMREAPPAELGLVVEVLHAGSLIVDDIEDDSTYRRGELALHKRWGLPRALNAGCWLYFWPDALLERMGLAPPIELAVRRLISRTLLRAHQGQAIDLSTRVFELQQSEVPGVAERGNAVEDGRPLMQLAASLGAVAAGAPRQTVAELGRFGEGLGVALQMLDDLGGIVSESRCHKGHEDLITGRVTWPFAWAARELDPLAYAQLRDLARKVYERELHPEVVARALREQVEEPGRRAIDEHLARSFAALENTFGRVPVLADIKAELELLGRSYG